MADQPQNPERKGSDGHRHDAEDKDIDHSPHAPNPTDLEFFNDPTIYERGDVPTAAKETHEKSGTERDSGPRGNRRPDEDIKAEIERLMAWQKTIDAAAIQVDVQDGVVTLSGNVSSPYEKQVARNISENVLGIQKINNLLNINRQDEEG